MLHWRRRYYLRSYATDTLKVPETTTVKVTFAPTQTTWFTGCVVIAVEAFTVKAAELEVTGPQAP